MSGAVGQPFSMTWFIAGYQGSASLTPAIYMDSSLPPGLTATVSGMVLTISGTPTTAGTFLLVVGSSNRCAPEVRGQIGLVVVGALAVSTTSLPDGALGVPYSEALQATGGATPYAWSPDPTSPPPSWLTLDGDGTLHGTPPAAAPASFRVTVTDSGVPQQSATSMLLTLNVASSLAPPVITTQPASVAVTAGQPAAFSVTASGTGPLSYQWQLSTDGGASYTAVPGGPNSASLTLASTTISQSGQRYRVVVSNSVGSVTSSAAILTVTPVATLAITTPALAKATDATGSSLYSAILTATGGVAPYAWSVQGLPPGLAVSTNIDNTGSVTGSPRLGGMFPIIVTVTDAAAATGVKFFTLTVPCIYHTTPGQAANENAALTGAFAYRFAGFDSGGHALARVGGLSADGNTDGTVHDGFGLISGEQDSAQGSSGGASFKNEPLVPLTSGSPASGYCIGGERGTLTLVTGSSSVIYSLALAAGSLGAQSSASLAELDIVDGAHGAGVLKPQTATAVAGPASYVFGFSGRDATNSPASVAGVFAVDASLTGTAGEDDFNDPTVNPIATPVLNNNPIAASFVAPADSFGRVTGRIAVASNATATGEIDFAAYTVGGSGGGAAELFVVGSGSGALAATAVPVLSGVILRQTVTQPVDANSLYGYAIFYLSGASPIAPAAGDAAATVGFVQVTPTAVPPITSGRILNLSYDSNIGGTLSGPVLASSGGYTVGADGRATISLAPGVTLPPPIVYLTSLNTGVLLDTSPGAGLGRMFKFFFVTSGQPTLGTLTAAPPAVAGTFLASGQVSPAASPATGLQLTEDVDSPLAGPQFAAQVAGLPLSPMDPTTFRFTVGSCPPPPATAVCLVGYGYYGSLASGSVGDLLIDESNATVGRQPSVMFWGTPP